MRRIARQFSIDRIAIALMFLTVVSAAHAEPITYNFSGTTERFDDIMGGFADIPGGTPFSGSFTYDPQIPLIDKTPLIAIFGDTGDDPTTKDYGSPLLGPPLPGHVLNATMNVGGLPSFAIGSPVGGVISIRNDQMFGWPTPLPSDTFILSVGDPNGNWVEVKLADPTGQALASTALPSTLDLAKFSQASVEYKSAAGLVAGDITSLVPVNAPEPSVFAILALGALGMVFRRHKIRGRNPSQ
ncbi:PEP-CTERM sorting domain-containing protein [Singulisphaera rosea]